MSVPGWLKLGALALTVVGSMFLGALLVPAVTPDASAPPQASPTPAPTQQAVSRVQEPERELRGVVVVDIGNLADVVAEVAPSVVYIESLQGGARAGGPLTSGSGFVLDVDGHILTNYHVIEGYTDVKVTFHDGSAALGRVLGVDPGSDLAVIHVDHPSDRLQPVHFGDSDAVRPGDPVFAIGNPYSHRNTVTSGIISAVGRTTTSSFTGRSIRDVIQVDAAVNPGNSGGPLFNYAGEVIGINTSIENPNGRFFVGLGFAVPSNTAARHLTEMIAGSTVAHPQLGVTVQPLDEVVAAELGVPVARGVYVTGVTAGTAADRAGIRAAPPSERGGYGPGGDVIVMLGGLEVRSFEDLARAIDRHDVGDQIVIIVNRDGDEISLTAQLQLWDTR